MTSRVRAPRSTGSRRSRPVAGLFVALALGVLIAGCSPREHTNPFDPDNEDTKGTPGLLKATAGDARVTLGWSVGEFSDLDHVRIRREAGGVSQIVADTLAPGVLSFVDTDVVNESTYDYTLEIFFRRDPEPARSRTVSATPGHRIIWVLDQRVGGPILVSPDGRQQAATPGEGRPSDLDVHPATGDVVSVDFFNGRIERFDRSGNVLGRLSVVSSPLSVALVPGDSTIWVGAYDPSGITRYSPSLNPTGESDTLAGVPEDLAYDPDRGDLWIADSDQGRVLHRRANGSLEAIPGFQTPFSVAIDAASGDLWLVDRVRATVYRIDHDKDSVLVANDAFVAPFQVISDPTTGGAWVTDNASGRVVRLDAAAAVAQVLTDFDEPTGIALDPGDGNLWITDRGDRDELVRVARSGEVLSRAGGFSSPFAVVVAVPSR